MGVSQQRFKRHEIRPWIDALLQHQRHLERDMAGRHDKTARKAGRFVFRCARGASEVM
jgi:hypothetical protein